MMVYPPNPPPPPPPRLPPAPNAINSYSPQLLLGRGGSLDLLNANPQTRRGGLDDALSPLLPVLQGPELFPPHRQDTFLNVQQQPQQQLTIQGALRSLETRIAHEVARLDQERT
ncbi:hypothetical protein DUNSADRAFT_15966, partial [Dunaliella salina]